MKLIKVLGDKLRGLTESILRYPLTVALLIAAAVMISVQINSDADLLKFILACAVGAMACAVGQAAYERFFTRFSVRIILQLAGFVLAVLHYLIIWQLSEFSPELAIRTAVAVFALMITFIWIAVIKSRVSFNESFMATFKSLFQSAFFSAVIMAGCSAIIAAIDELITPIDSDAYSHIANIVFVLFAPIFFLSLIPVYPGKRDKNLNEKTNAEQEEIINKRTYCPKFFEVLLSYIIIPLASVFTLILLIYIILNIRGEFWTNNLLEPLLVSYTIIVIVVTILVSRLENHFAVLFRRIFPKVLIPIALFQTASSLLVMMDTGVTFSRYYVILYGIFAVSSGVILSFVPVKKNGIIAALLIAFSIISILPPVDAFTVSRSSQINTLERVLEQNGMLTFNGVTPNASISDDDKSTIISSVQYLSRMEDIDKIAWLPDDFSAYDANDFYDTFGFYEYEGPDISYRYVNVYLDEGSPISIDNYEFLTQMYINSPKEIGSLYTGNIDVNGVTYSLSSEYNGDYVDIVLKDESGLEMIRFSTNEIYSRYESYATDQSNISIEEATFNTESDSAELRIVVQNASIEISSGSSNFYAQLYVLVDFK